MSRLLFGVAALCFACPLLAEGLAGAAPAPEPTAPESREACLGNYEQAQVLRIDKKLMAARNAALSCAVTACPGPVRSDCTAWVAELSQLIPTLLLVAESGSGELESVRVTMDGSLLTEKLDGTTVEVEPGQHVLRFEHEGDLPVERRVTVAEGEKGLMVRVRLASATPLPVVAAPSPAPSPATPRDQGERPVPLLTYVFGGVALVATGTSAAFAVSAFNERSAANRECAPTCDPSRIDTIRKRFRAADLVGAAAVASGGLALFFYFTRPEVQKEQATTVLRIARQGSTFELTAGGSF